MHRQGRDRSKPSVSYRAPLGKEQERERLQRLRQKLENTRLREQRAKATARAVQDELRDHA
jgi:hypothetical protein